MLTKVKSAAQDALQGDSWPWGPLGTPTHSLIQAKLRRCCPRGRDVSEAAFHQRGECWL